MKKVIVMVVLGIGGLAAAIALTVGALALAGNDVGSVVQPTLVPSESRSPSHAPSPSGDDDPSSTPSPSVDDHGGDADPDDNSGSGSDSSGSGSDSSGSGSDSSGSGSDSSGSGDPDDD